MLKMCNFLLFYGIHIAKFIKYLIPSKGKLSLQILIQIIIIVILNSMNSNLRVHSEAVLPYASMAFAPEERLLL